MKFGIKRGHMKTTALSLWMIIGVMSSSTAQEMLSIEVTNIKNTSGNIMVGLFNNEETFLKDAVIGQTIKASDEKIVVTFKNVPMGEYAISVIHDENENGELDANMVGIPKEGFAFGNNAMGAFGPPSFDKAKVKLNGEPVKQVIKLKYF
jgi:uncharacterized protein (DUF2141 family)